MVEYIYISVNHKCIENKMLTQTKMKLREKFVHR